MYKNTQFKILITLFILTISIFLLPCLVLAQEGSFIMSFYSNDELNDYSNKNMTENLYDFAHIGLLEEMEKTIEVNQKNIAKLNILGQIYINLGKNDKAMLLYNTLMGIVRENSKWNSVIVNNIAVLYYRQKDYDTALKKLNSLLNNTENASEKALYNNNIGVIYAEQNNFGQAKEYFNQIREWAKENEIKNIDAVYNNIGEILRREGKLTEAMEYFNDALETIGEKSNIFSEAQILNNIATVDYLRGNYNQAIRYFNKSVELNSKILNTKELSKNYSNLGYTFLLKERYDKSLMYFQKELTINKKLNSKIRTSLSYNKIGMVKFHQEEYNDAIVFYNMAIDNYNSISLSDENIANFYINLSLVYQKLGKYEPAIKNMRTGVDIQNSIRSSYYERNKKLLEELIDINKQNND
jgi:tetratricopeptide (TPR) repeat protein